MATYYIDSVSGRADASGLSPEQPLASSLGLCVKPGDSVLFKRGSEFFCALNNVSGEPGSPVRYGAYGDGPAPRFNGSIDVSKPSDWRNVGGNVWKCLGECDTQVCNFVFNDEVGAAFRWDREALTENGDFWDSAFGTDFVKPEDHEVLLYCEKNPAEYYNKVECVLRRDRNVIGSGHDFIITDLDFIKSGVHGLSGLNPNRNITISRCRFAFIGGCCWSKDLRIRFGNGLEFWNVCENVRIDHCTFYDIYDSAITHQGIPGEVEPAVDFVMKNNLFVRCGMGAYEQRDVQPLRAEFSGNVCMEAGRGFSHLHTPMPRMSEIWPAPMGHHVFLWRMDYPTAGAEFIIKDNTFLDAPWGAAIYSVCCREVDDSTVVDGNIYHMPEHTLINRICGHDYDDFATYQTQTGKDPRGIIALSSANL